MSEKTNKKEEKGGGNYDLKPKVLEAVKETFKNNPSEKSLFVTEDGQIFLSKNKSYAENHCKRNGAVKREKALECIEVLRSEVV